MEENLNGGKSKSLAWNKKQQIVLGGKILPRKSGCEGDENPHFFFFFFQKTQPEGKCEICTQVGTGGCNSQNSGEEFGVSPLNLGLPFGFGVSPLDLGFLIWILEFLSLGFGVSCLDLGCPL